MKKVLVLGAAGQLGSFLLRRYSEDAEISLVGYSRQELDITNFDQIESILDQECPFAVVNAAAYTNVDKAESNQHGMLTLKVPALLLKLA